MPNPFFTVITVTYNSSQFVRDAIESVLASTFLDFELILGDDCSTDNTWGVINEYNDPRIIKYRNSTNLREYSNRHKALSMAKGNWVIFIDGDDFLYTNGLLKIADYIFNAPPSVGLLCMYDYLNWARIPFQIKGTKYILLSSTEKSLNNIAFTNTVIRIDLIKKYFPEILKFKNGDQILRLLVAKESDVLVIEDQLTWWRQTPGQASSKISSNIENYLLNVSFNLRLIRSLDVEEEIKIQFEVNKLIEMRNYFISQLRSAKILNIWRMLFFDMKNSLSALILMNRKSTDFLPNNTPVNPVKCFDLLD